MPMSAYTSAKLSAYFAEFMQILLFVLVQIAYRNSFNYNQYLNNNTLLIWLECVCACVSCVYLSRGKMLFICWLALNKIIVLCVWAVFILISAWNNWVKKHFNKKYDLWWTATASWFEKFTRDFECFSLSLKFKWCMMHLSVLGELSLNGLPLFTSHYWLQLYWKYWIELND